jgi:hypothetical protein
MPANHGIHFRFNGSENYAIYSIYL